MLVDEKGADSYHGAFLPEWSPDGRGVAGSGGFGADDAVGILADRAGVDAYAMDGEAAATCAARRSDGAAFGGPAPLCDSYAPMEACVAATGSHGGRGVFLDDA